MAKGAPAGTTTSVTGANEPLSRTIASWSASNRASALRKSPTVIVYLFSPTVSNTIDAFCLRLADENWQHSPVRHARRSLRVVEFVPDLDEEVADRGFVPIRFPDFGLGNLLFHCPCPFLTLHV